MTSVAFEKLICPLDGMPLKHSENSWRCTQGHNFDVARQGYIHLLPVQAKRSKDPGDHKAMVEARQRFLSLGHYQSIAENLQQRVAASAPPASGEPLSCLDAGCGEGHYLRCLLASEPSVPVSLVGVDISKWAVQAAARQSRAITWLVASNTSLPVESASLDWVFCLFGFPAMDEFLRVLKPGGRLLMVDPGDRHLQELKQVIYERQQERGSRFIENPAGFGDLDEVSIRETFTVNGGESLMDLLAMTPHFYRVGAAGRARLLAMDALTLTLDVTFRIYQKI